MRGVSQKGDASSPDMSPNTAKSYSRFKTFNGKQYTGMKVGMLHKLYYDKGEWKEKQNKQIQNSCERFIAAKISGLL
jgi:hypothetical protein